MKTDLSNKHTTSLANLVAPEDLKCGDVVAVLYEIVEYPSFFWCDSMPSERGELVRLRCVPANTGTPLKVKAVCLPFVFVKSPGGRCETLDIRQVQLVRLSRAYARKVWKSLNRRQTQREQR